MLKGLVLAGGGFVLFLVLHVCWFRLRVPEHRFLAFARLWAAVWVGLALVHLATPPDLGLLPRAWTGAGWAVDLLNAALVYGFLFIGYSMFYFLMDRGFSGRIMIEIDSAPGHKLRPPDIAARYSMRMLLQRRLSEMIELNRSVVERDGRYCNTHKGRATATLFAFLKRFFHLGEGG